MKTPRCWNRALGPLLAAVAASAPLGAQRPDTVLRRLYFTSSFHDGARIGDSLVRRFPRDTRLRAWYVANLGGAGSTALADSLTARIDTTTRDAWLLAGRAFARMYAGSSSKDSAARTLRLAQRARALAPNDPDLAWLTARLMPATGAYVASDKQTAVIAFIDSVAPRVGMTLELQLSRAAAVYASSNRAFDRAAAGSNIDTARRNEAFRAYAAIRAANPAYFRAFYDGSFLIRGVMEDSVLPLTKRAVEIAPRAAVARTAYWNAINGQRGPSVAEKKAVIAADRAAFLALTDSAPWALATVVSSMRGPNRDSTTSTLEDRILARAPRSSWAEDVMLARANLWRDSLFAARDTARPGPKSDSGIVKQRYYRAIEAFIEKPWVANPASRDQAVLLLFFEVKDDLTYPNDKLVALIKTLVATGTGAPSFRLGESARALATRKIEFRYAEQLSRDALKAAAHYLDDFPGYTFTSVGDKADVLESTQATIYDDLGYVFFNEGNYTEADKQLSHALELSKKNVTIYYDLGRLRAAQGREEEAELMYAQGMTVRFRGVNPNREELQRLYEKKHGSIDGWEKYIASLEEKEREVRKAKILGSRDKEPKLVPGFSLADLSGKTVKSDSLRAQFVVVNFWGTWCGPCVAEMPELQQFYDKYRNDKSVAIFTISNDKDLGELRDWMAKRKLTIPTLFDDGYVSKLAQIHVFPTTWFIDKDGKVQFSAIGNTGSLLDEWTWRLEATKAGVSITP